MEVNLNAAQLTNIMLQNDIIKTKLKKIMAGITVCKSLFIM